MDFAILGPLVVRSNEGTDIELGGARRRTLVSRLLVDANLVVTSAALCEDVWRGSPPAGAAQTLQSHVSSLRKVLGHDRVRTVGNGYALLVDRSEVDSFCFEADVAEAHKQLDAGDASGAADRLIAALRLWRGNALGDVAAAPWAVAEAARLEELRRVAYELLLDAWLALGDNSRVVTESTRLIGVYPFHERFWAQAMLALYRSERQTDALRTYARLRDTLVDELGIEPSSELARLERAVLNHDQSLLLDEGRESSLRVAKLPSGVVTFVLTDVVSSTRLWDQAAAAMAEALERHDEIVRRAVVGAGGVLLKARGEGDSTFSVFQRATDALAAAVELQRGLKETAWPVEAVIGVRVAVHSGEAVERDGDFFGPTVNRAARLRGAAAMGDVLVSASTAELVVDRLPPGTRLVELGTIGLRDLARPEVTYVVRAESLDQGDDAARTATPAPTPIPVPARLLAIADPVERGLFAGRTQELERLRRAFEEASSGHGGVVVISGEPGIGKTRLAAAASYAAHQRGATVLFGRSDRQLGMSFQPWIEVLSHLVAHAPESLLAAHVATSGAYIARLVPELAQRVQPLMLSDDSSVDERYLLFRAVGDLLERMASLTPLVVVIDDLHEADRPSLELFSHLARADGPSRVVIIATNRSDEVDLDHPLAELLTAGREPHIEPIALRGLDGHDVLSLLEALAGRELGAEGERLRDELVAETDGNPFFIVELLRHLGETAAVRYDRAGRWVAVPALLDHRIPKTIRDVVARRAELLGADAELMLGIGAVIGREFDVELVAGVSDRPEDDVIEVCDRAVAAGLLRESTDDDRYAFAHALIARALAERLSGPRRARLHRAVAIRLEELVGSSEERVGELAHHWSRTGRNDGVKVAYYAQRAGDRALHLLAPDEAERWFETGIAALDQVGDPLDGPQRVSLLCGLGEAQRDLGYPAHRETLLSAARTADVLGQTDVLIRAALANHRGWTSVIGTVDHERVEILQRALSLAEPDSPVRARLLATLCAEQHYGIELEDRVALAREAVRIARLNSDPRTLAFALSMPFLSITMPQTLELRSHWTDEACSLADRTSDPTIRFWTHTYRGLAALSAGDLDALRDHTSMASAEATRIGRPSLVWEDTLHRASSEILAGELATAEQTAASAFELGTSLGHPDALTIYGGHLNVIRWMQGRLAEILPLLLPAADAHPDIQIYRAGLIFALAREGRRREASDMLEPLFENEFKLFEDANWLMSQVLLAEASARIGHSEAMKLLRDRLTPFRSQFAAAHSTVVGAVSHYLGTMAAAMGERRAARDYFEEALAIHQRLEAPYFVTATESVLGALLTRSRDAAEREQARTLLHAALTQARNRGFGYVAADTAAALRHVGAQS